MKPPNRTCLNRKCRKKFIPKRNGQGVCSYQCGIAYSRWLEERKRERDNKEERKRIKKKKIDIMSVDEYRKDYVQPVLNEIARLIDHGQPCIATGNFGKMAGGHYTSVGSNRTLALNLHNIHIQSFHSNGPKGGDNIKYREGLEKTYGREYMEYVEGLRKCPPIKLSKDDLMVVRVKAMKVRNRLRQYDRKFKTKERIKTRNWVNKKLGIYPYEFTFFEKSKVPE